MIEFSLQEINMKFRHRCLRHPSSLFTAASCHNEAKPAANDDSDTADVQMENASPWPDFMNAFIEDYLALNPGFAVNQGRHEFDGQLPDWSEDGLAAAITMRKNAIADASAVNEADMTDAEKFERDYLVAVMDGELFWLETADMPHKNPGYYVGEFQPVDLCDATLRGSTTRMKAFILKVFRAPP
ncbi:MAG: hypothetical protein R3C40_03220 [Parvularculaceae bacterium]